MGLKLLVLMIKMMTVSLHTLSPPPPSPCPQLFNYGKIYPVGDIVFPGKDNLYWRGMVRIPRKAVITGKALHLRVLMSVPTALQTKYVGRIEFLGDKEKLVKGDFTSVEYSIFFPSNIPIPNLLQLRVNEKVLCNGLPSTATVVTKIILEHSLFPMRFNITPRILDSSADLQQNCTDDQPAGPLAAGEWPWLVPIFAASKNGRNIEFLCAGSLITDRFLISAAHCFHQIENPKILVAYVGRKNIRNWADTESQPRSFKNIHIHPDFNATTLYSDIAILELSSPVVRSRTARPVCLWQGSVDLDLIVGRKATVVGWGTDDAGKTEVTSEPNSAELPIVSQETCMRSSVELYYFSSNRTLCAGARDGSGPCHGDSGGGLYISIRDSGGNTRWYLRGVVSLSLLSSNHYSCDLGNFALFTDVAQFKMWLQTIITDDSNQWR